METKKTILFTATFDAPFISDDISMLRRHFTVRTIIDSGPLSLLRYLFTLPTAALTFSWFASVYSSLLVMMGKLFRKKSVLILGGVDVAKIPEMHYGIWNSRWKSVLVRYGIRNADIVIAVDPSIKNDAMILAEYHGNNISVLPTGHDETRWTPDGSERKNVILTVAVCDTMTRYKIKGIDFLSAVAAAAPDLHFVLIGMSREMQKQFPVPPNLRAFESIPREQLLDYYRSSKVYFQPSFREAFGSALCEAMLCGCYPVGTKTGGIPTVIGDTGTIISFGEIKEAIAELRLALQQKEHSSARERIITHFSLAKRELGLLTMLSTLHVH